MDRDGDSPKQNSHRCDRCHQCFADLQILEEHKRSDCDKTLSCKEASSPKLPPRQEIDGSQHFYINDYSPRRRRIQIIDRSIDKGKRKSPCKLVTTPPACHISSKPMGSPGEKKVNFSPDLKRSMSPCEKGKSPPPAISPKIIDSPPVAQKLNFLPDQGTSKSPSKTSLEVTSKPMGSPGEKKVNFSPDLKRSMSPCEKGKSTPPAVSPKIIISPPAARNLNFLPDQGTSKSPSKTSLVVSGNKANSPGSSSPDRDSSRSPCTKALKSGKTNRLLAEQSWMEASNSAAHFTSLYEAAIEKKENASKSYADARKVDKSLTVASEVKAIVSNMRERAYSELVSAIEEESRALQSLEEALRFEKFCRDAAAAAAIHERAILEAAKSYNADRDKHSAGSPNRKVRFSPDQRTSPSSRKTSKTPLSVVSSNSPGPSSQVDLTQAFAATLEEEKAIAESGKSVKAEGDGNGTNLELQALEGDMKQSESNQTSKNELPKKTLDCVTEKDEDLKPSNLKEATNVLHAQDDGIDFPSASVTHHGRWTQRQQSSLDVPDQHQGADAATSSSHVAESLKQSDKSPESTETTD